MQSNYQSILAKKFMSRHSSIKKNLSINEIHSFKWINSNEPLADIFTKKQPIHIC